MEATKGRVASPHFGCAAAESGCLENEHTAL
jgi:hypothetical protein